MKFETVASVVENVPFMSREEGRRVYEHLRSAGARDVLELGTGWGVSAAYMAAALDENGGGAVTTVDHQRARRQADAAELFKRVGITHLVRQIVVEDSSYTWWLKAAVEARSDDAGNCEPAYDFCYLDGAHNWTIDGLAVILVEKLLRPGAWLLLDDLRWSYGSSSGSFGEGQGPDDLRLSAAETSEPHMRAVFELIIKQHPSFARFRIEDGRWGWAQKTPGAPRRYEVTSTVSPAAAMRAQLHSLKRRLARGRAAP